MKQALLIILILFSLNFTNVSHRELTSVRNRSTIVYTINTESDKNTSELIRKKREFIVVNYIMLLSSVRAVDFFNEFYNTS